MDIRAYESRDLAALYAINVEGEPGVGAVTQDGLAAIVAEGTCLVAEGAAGPEGFILLVEPGAAYGSPNYQWFLRRHGAGGDFVYVDRIAIGVAGRGKGLGAALYGAAFEVFAGQRAVMTCEVNTLPPNPGSMRFHQRLGFEPVGEQVFIIGEKAVAYLERPL